MHRRPTRRIEFRPFAERLETRDCPSVTIQLDYTLDVNNFFDTPAKRAVLQEAADTIGARLGDTLTAIVPTGGDTWSEVFPNPSSGLQQSILNRVVAANTIVVYAGGRPLLGAGELGVGSTGGTTSRGTAAWNNLVQSRGQMGALLATPTDFGPWGGSLSFDTSASFYFGVDPSGQKSTQSDFLSVAQHELFHLLGFGTAPSWNALATGSVFAGPVSKSVYEGVGSPPLAPDHAHWATGTTSGGTEAVLDPSILVGTRKLLTRLDYAGLQDVGWSLLTDPGSTIATAGAPQISSTGSITLTGLSLGPELTGLQPADVDLYKIVAGPGLVFTATTSLPPSGTSVDTYLRLFDAAGNPLQAANTGIYDTLKMTLPASGGIFYLGVSSAANTAYSATDDLARRLAGPVGDYNLTLRLDSAVGGLTSDLSAQISAPTQATQGQPFLYTISIANAGPDLAGGVRIDQLMPPGVRFVSASSSQGTVTETGGFLLAQIGAVPPGSTVIVQVSLIPDVTGPVALAARVSSLQADPNLKDNVGSATINVNPAPITPPPPDTTPPVIVGVRIMSTGKGPRKVSTIVVSFSKSLDPAHLSAFLLTKPGRAKRHAPPPRVPVKLKPAMYNAANLTVSLVISTRGSLPRGLQLFVSGSLRSGLRDLAGNVLDGDRNGVAGGDALIVL